MTVEYRQRTGQAECDGIDVGVRIVAETIRAGAEQLGERGEFYVDFEANDELPSINQDLVPRSGTGGVHEAARCTGGSMRNGGVAHFAAPIARSRAAAVRNICGSPKVPARI